MKIYIVFEDWAHEGSGEDSKPLKAFKTQKQAIAFMHKKWEQLMDEDYFSEFDTEEESKTHIEAWKDGDYLLYHEKLEVVECEMAE